ncbi:hypothetical protein [Streptomyces sp. NPDC058683]|uniref:hypothetical protein n=1 Tax=Streptomyces sp. NPDC058683 TaxID=3346597 RepID=UPI00365FA50C
MKAAAVVGNPQAAARARDAVERVRTAGVVIAACPTCKGTCTTDDSPARRTGRWGPAALDTAKARTAR